MVRSKVYSVGDHVDTDRIIAGKYTKTLDERTLAAHVFEDLDPHFRERFIPGDIIAAGWNFGCGSSREQAPRALKTVGVRAVIARSFARIFYRNAINIGLRLYEIPEHNLITGQVLEVDLESHVLRPEKGLALPMHPLPEVMNQILQAGGLVAYLRQHQTFNVEGSY